MFNFYTFIKQIGRKSVPDVLTTNPKTIALPLSAVPDKTSDKLQDRNASIMQVIYNAIRFICPLGFERNRVRYVIFVALFFLYQLFLSFSNTPLLKNYLFIKHRIRIGEPGVPDLRKGKPCIRRVLPVCN